MPLMPSISAEQLAILTEQSAILAEQPPILTEQSAISAEQPALIAHTDQNKIRFSERQLFTH